MNCEYISDNLSDCLDGLLSADTHEAYIAHLARCAECRQLIDLVSNDSQHLSSLTPPPVPAELKMRVMSEVRREARQTRRRSRPLSYILPRLAPVAAALIVSVAGSAYVPVYLASQNKMLTSSADPAPMAPPAAGDVRTTEGEQAKTDEMGVMSALSPDDHPEDSMAFASPREWSLWQKVAVGGSVVFVLWSSLVVYWYTKQ